MTGPLSALLIAAAGLLLVGAAPAPSGPDALPAQVAGVIGSGDRLSLQLRATDAAPARIVQLGEAAIDGWALTGLTNTTATLGKDGQSRTIGLNPSGALAIAQPAARPSLVRVTVDGVTPEMATILAVSDEELLAQMSPAQRDAYEKTPAESGLTAEEGKRLKLYALRSNQLFVPVRDATEARVRAAQAQGINAAGYINLAQVSAPLFGQDYVDLLGKRQQYDYQQRLVRYEAGLAAGVRIVLAPPGQTPPPYSMQTAANITAVGQVMVLVPPVQPGPADEFYPFAYATPVSLTAEMVAAMTLADGTPVGAADQAAALAANQQLLAARAAELKSREGVTYYGPFGVVPPPR